MKEREKERNIKTMQGGLFLFLYLRHIYRGISLSFAGEPESFWEITCLGQVFNSTLGRFASLHYTLSACLQPLLELKTQFEIQFFAVKRIILNWQNLARLLLSMWLSQLTFRYANF